MIGPVLPFDIWSLKDKGIPYNIKWRKVKQARQRQGCLLGSSF